MREDTSGVSIVGYEGKDRSEVKITLEAASASLGQGTLDAHGGLLQWQADGNARIDNLVADHARGRNGTVKLRSAEISGLRLNEQIQLSADILAIDELDLYIKRSLLHALLWGTGSGDVKIDDQGRTITETESAAPESETHKADVTLAQTLLTEIGYAPGPVDGQMGRRTVAAIKAFQQREGLTVDGRLTESLLTALQNRAAKPSAEERKSLGAHVRIGQLALTGTARIRFNDDTVDPPVTTDAVIKKGLFCLFR